MTSATLPLLDARLRPAILDRPAATPRPTPLDRPPGGSAPSLDMLVTGAWEGLTGGRREVSCFFCGGAMSPRFGSTASAVGGRCRDCGSSLS